MIAAVGGSDLTLGSPWLPDGKGGAGSVPAPNADLVPAASGEEPPSLSDLIRRGDPDALAGFRNAHADQVRCYCDESCLPERFEEAVEAAFSEFVGRLLATDAPVTALEDLLLSATRSAAAARFRVVYPPRTHRPLPRSRGDITCEVMPELLAAKANGELAGDPTAVQIHVDGCATCSGSDARMLLAERAFRNAAPVRATPADAPGDGSPQPQEHLERFSPPERSPETDVPAKPGAAAPAPPAPEPPSPPPPPVTTRKRRKGGLVGTVRRMVTGPPG